MGLLSNNLDRLYQQIDFEKQAAMGAGRALQSFMRSNPAFSALRNKQLAALRKALNRINPRWAALRLNRPAPTANSYPIPNMYTRSGILGIY